MTNSLDTDFDQSPYWADYDANSEYYQILFKGSTPVQIRELNNLQFAAQKQIGSFANNIFTQGTIIAGCNINLDPNLKYVKLLDTYANGSAVTLQNFNGLIALSNTSGLSASIFSTSQGFISQAPNLNTLFIKYLNTGYVANSSNLSQNVAVSTFQPDEIISIVNPANIVIGTIQVANDSISGNSGAVGNSYSLSVDNGEIFQKGYDLIVKNQNIIVTPYTNQPDGLSVGFISQESIVTSYQDPTLLDNAQGSPNFKGPGADRLKIVPTLEVVNTGSGNNDFFAIVDFVGGNAAIINQDTSFNVIGDKIAQVSSETNGNFVIRPFNLSSQEAVFANGVIDANNFRLNISSGLGYIQGQRVNLLSQIFTTLRKGTDVNYQTGQILTAQMGNFVLGHEIYGTVDPTNQPTVGLLGANSYGVSNNEAKGVAVASMSPSANIGTATLLSYLPVNAPGTGSNSQGLFYLYNIQMNTGFSFANVQGIYCNNNSRIMFADILPYNGVFGVNQPQFAPLIYQLGSTAVQQLKTSSNTRDTQFVIQESASVSFNTSGQATVTIPSYTGGINELPFGTGNVTATQLKNDFNVVCEANASMANLTGSFTATGTANVTGTSTNWDTSLFPGALVNFSNSTTTVVRMVSAIANATSLNVYSTVPSMSGNVSMTFLSGQIIPMASLPNSSVSITNSTSFVVSLGNNLLTSMAANVFYQVERTQAAPAQKTLQTSLWVAINCASHSANFAGPWSLGVPDGYKVNHVYVGTTFANTNPDLATEFNLFNGQQDQYYGLSTLSSNGWVGNTNSRILVNFQAFLPNWTSGEGYFSVESYPVDDTGVTANSIFTQDIPFYYSISSQTNYNLRNALDFRFYAANTAAYISTAASAPVNPSSTLTFNNTAMTPIVVDSQIESSYSYYMGRYDQVGLTATANVIVNEGTPSQNPVPGGQVINGMNIGTIFIPPYPSLTQDVVDTSVPFSYPRISFVYTTNKRYTMQDIGAIDQRLSQVEYYSALSVLEQSVTNLLTQASSGHSIFQNGIFADPMQNFSLANCADPAFNFAIDSVMEVGRPTFSQYPVQLKYISGGNTSQFSGGRLISLTPTSNTVLISQPFASQVRNCAQDVTYSYSGTLSLKPDGDYQPDITVNPAVVAHINDYQNFVAIANAWPTQWGAWNETTTTSVHNNGLYGAVNPLNGIYDLVTTATATTTQTSTRTGTQLVATPEYNEYQLGTAITNISIQPYARAAWIAFTAYGLKPSTQHYVYVNDKPMSNHCFQTDLAHSHATGAIGDKMITDATGAIAGYLYLPANTFNTGSLNFQILDISNNVTELNVIQSAASATYYATNLAYTENNLELQTVTGQLSQTQVTQSISNTSTSTAITGVLIDPIAQSFTVLPSLVNDGSDCVYLKSISLYFEAKHPTLGITVQVRPLTSSGLPDQYTLPYGTIHLTPSQINVSNNATVVTNVVFPDPLLLETGSSYCFICLPDGSNPNYNIWTGVLGANNVTGGKIYALSATGVMLLSSQGITWTPYQTESIKFALNIDRWAANTGYASFVNDDSEYFNISNVYGTFRLGDNLIMANMANNIIANANATINTTSNTIVTGNTTGLGTNTQVIVVSPNNQTGFLTSVVSVTNTTAFVANLKSSFNDTLSSVFIANGNPTGVVADITSDKSFLRISNSSANSSNYLKNTYSYMVLDTTTNAFATAANLHDVSYNTLMAKFAPTIPARSNLSIVTEGISNAHVVDSSWANLAIGVSSDFLDVERLVMSRSNEIQYNSNNKSLFINANMTTNSTFQSPTLDTIKLGAHTVHNLVIGENANNDVYTSEIQNVGNGFNRYISSSITLAAGMDAENLTVYLGAHWPAGTQIYVYSKLLNQYDPGSWQSKVWSPMVTTNTYRSSVNPADFSDYQFSFANTVLTTGAAYLDPSNNNVLTYQSGGVSYAGFVTFAVKVVLLSNSSPLVPMVTALRTVATTSSN